MNKIFLYSLLFMLFVTDNWRELFLFISIVIIVLLWLNGK